MNDLLMPLLDIGVAQPSFQNHHVHTRSQLFTNCKATNYSLLQYEERWTPLWKVSPNPKKMNIQMGHHEKLHPKLLVKAVATLEPKISVQNEDGGRESNSPLSIDEVEYSAAHFESSDANSKEIDAREKLRRMKISKANKGNTPWNKGRKHSPETIQRIRERTKLAMQNPKVRMKLASFGHAQSQETRDKIGEGVRMGWRRRRQRMKIQETCLFDWQNLITEAARKGFNDEEELEWNSYEILNKQLQQKWLDNIEYRKTMPRSKTNKRAPKSLEQRRKIAEAIAAKWADPEYRARVCSGLAKRYGTPEGAERKVKKKPSGEGQFRRTSKKKMSDAEGYAQDELKARSQQSKVKKGYVPKYKDPLASSKLEMLKSIRAQRVASQTKTNETMERAKVIIVEAEKAAKALEVVATRSPVAQASLIEARLLIAEATQTIEKIENGEIDSLNDAAPGYHQNDVENSGHSVLMKDPSEAYLNGINSIGSLQVSQGQNSDFNLYSLTMLGGYNFSEPENDNPATQFGADQRELCRDSDINSLTPTSRKTNIRGATQEFDEGDAGEGLDLRGLTNERFHQVEPNGVAKLNGCSAPNGAKSHFHEAPAAKTVTKRWVRGRLVEAIEGE